MSLGQWLGGRRGGRDPWMSGSPFSTDLWDPFVGSSLGQLDRGGDETTALAYANVDWCETDKAHIFHADLPGVRKEDVKVHVEDDNVLQISGDRIKEQEEKTDRWHRVERSRGSFTRRFRLPENANLDEIKCELANGVLTVTVPKKEVEQPQKNVRPITVA